MVNKKYKFLLGILFLLLSSGGFAQVGGKGSVYDSSVIPAKRMPQQNEFWNSSYNFPAKPRNMWEIGISGGMFSVSGDVATRIPTIGFAAHVRKAFGYVFSLRLQYLNATGKGLNWLSSANSKEIGSPALRRASSWACEVPGTSLRTCRVRPGLAGADIAAARRNIARWTALGPAEGRQRPTCLGLAPDWRAAYRTRRSASTP